ncbi:malonate decarboxylase subunit alpha [Mycolicibacterium smegmatis]|uniref:malonate decarboxylase subunit alpha n=1 Tax=Mycolicibacterium smegmatis TaxID=1772 RepID=UPI0005D99186|nr:malonate decarboxylase subunit alpha [Mycolicibacterium smegmatis]MDF1901453.1 malonate decarboxylase subunit alpha [Mycolicibacterium smegmatis]MDF1907677.1 malonate decarboxylase subunit alpha [Mycolicibacterium smegmatis]MDF1919509.1 malonate decarboxylase subunit alpha [Mycolicibacterium smegmatis]MDF1926254.1 malonate decarboxylase subunit alpha [Mycolicibacterium smegmatis]UAK57993.1 malonate decarboxylase subunit alpha [Mycolicibacterium smegmatis]
MTWDRRRRAKTRRMDDAGQYCTGKVIDAGRLGDLLQTVIHPGDRVALEGDNQKQADYLSRTLAACDPERLHDLHMLISSVSRPEHLDLFERGIATRLDLAYAGPQSVRIAQLVEDGTVQIGAIHTYVELYARMFTDLAPDVVLLCATAADTDGNLFTGPNTEDTPTIAEAAAFHDGVVIVQADRIVEPGTLPRIDIPGDWVDLVVAADRPFALEPLFTRDPRLIGPVEILKAMIAIRGVYERHEVVSLNHGIGFDTAAIELILPTYGERLGLKGRIAKYWTLNPHPTLIPAIESGWVESIHSFGGEAGMERYTAARPDVFFTGRDGSLRSNRVLCQLAGQYAVDMFIGSSLQIDRDGNSSTVTESRLPGFGGAPNMGHDPHGRRHASPSWLSMVHGEGAALRGRKLVVQIAQTFQKGGVPTFVESLDAVDVATRTGMPVPPVMIYGDDVTHIVTEEGVAYLYKAHSLDDRRAALAAVAGVTGVGRAADARRTEQLRSDGLVAFPEDLKVSTRDADRSLLAARSISDLVAWSGGLYDPPARFRDW